jgi:hypothetical protein
MILIEKTSSFHPNRKIRVEAYGSMASPGSADETNATEITTGQVAESSLCLNIGFKQYREKVLESVVENLVGKNWQRSVTLGNLARALAK